MDYSLDPVPEFHWRDWPGRHSAENYTQAVYKQAYVALQHEGQKWKAEVPLKVTNDSKSDAKHLWVT